ncbi:MULTISPECIES: GAP family protein [Pseudofrankia]|uniref:GAP family protein n=1 Tax=Pseudofrankia TaxID=2994363 RepID=UPI000234B159|nr:MULTISPECIES: GAP family protein [Pseudofrankia]OHV31815.1 hypothetical protein BCD49_05915 [Pseudofrankia sp. EUN1h]
MTSSLPLAIAAGIYPLGLAIVVRYLGDPPSLRHAFAYLGGAAAVTVGAGAAIVVALRVADLSGSQERTLSAGMQTFLGAVLLLVAFWVSRHRPTEIRRPSRRVVATSREVGGPDAARDLTPKEAGESRKAVGARTMFFVGVTTYLPSAFYVAALKNLAATDSGPGLTILSLFVCAALVLIMVEFPIVLRLLAPRQTGRILAAYNTWMGRHGWDVIFLVATVSGLCFLASGIVGLITSE